MVLNTTRSLLKISKQQKESTKTVDSFFLILKDKPMKFLGYVTKEELESTVNQLFDRIFIVTIDYIHLMNINEIQRYGSITSGDLEDDKKNANERITVGMTIPKLVELYKNQIPFYLTDRTDDRTMYEIIFKHIHEWRVYAENTIYLNSVPFEDLIDLSEFASAIYKSRDQTKDIDPEVARLRNRFGRANGFLGISDIIKPEAKKEEKKTEIDPHQPDAAILDQIYNNRRF